MKEKIKYFIEYKPLGKKIYYATSGTGFVDKSLAFKLACAAKESCPEMGVRIIQQKRKIIKVIGR